MSVPTMVAAIVSGYLTDKLLDAQADARARLIPFAERALERAKEQFDKDMELRGYDNTVYNYVKGLPTYAECEANIYRGQRTGHFTHMPILKKTGFNSSRYNCGDREEAIMNSLGPAIIRGGELAAEAGHFESALTQAYLESKYVALANSSSFRGSARATGAFGDIARSLIGQDKFLSQAAAGGIASFSYFAASLVSTEGRNNGQGAPVLGAQAKEQNLPEQGINLRTGFDQRFSNVG